MMVVGFVRQLEAVIRIAESLAKMELKPFASDTHVDEALRLFQVSTLDAASSGNLAGKLKIILLPSHLMQFNKMHTFNIKVSRVSLRLKITSCLLGLRTNLNVVSPLDVRFLNIQLLKTLRDSGTQRERFSKFCSP